MLSYRNASLASKQQTPTLPLPSCLRIPTFCITAKSLFTSLDGSDMLPTCRRHFSPTFTSALPPHYRQNNIYTDKTAATFSVHRPTAN